MSQLFSPYTLRNVTFRNRIGVSPMCMYSSEDGYATDFHLVHLGARALGGAGLVITEATAVTPEGRISGNDLGIWSDDHIPMLKRINGFVSGHGAVPGIQLGHAGRKASSMRPWDRAYGPPIYAGGWEPIGPSPIAFSDEYQVPREMTTEDIHDVVVAFQNATRRALEAGYQVIELHGAHGYLLNEFLSPLTNHRTDEYGGSFENRTRIVREVTTAVREVWPAGLPLFIRLSATDWKEGGWTIEDSVRLAKELVPLGVDIVDCSSGGNVAGVRIPVGPGYQVHLAEAIHNAGVPSAAVGLISAASQAEEIISQGKADMVLVARASLRDPNWPLRVAHELGTHVDYWPGQYERAKF